MTNKECIKAVIDQKEKADLINESIEWAAGKAHHAFDQIEELGDCYSIDCEKKRERYQKQASKYLNRLEHENSILDNYGDELEKVIEECYCTSGNINF